MKHLFNTINQLRYKIPFITIALAAVALLLYTDNVETVLQYNRSHIGTGELWRLVTSHWSHWSFDHLLWCTVTFIILGSICERFNWKGFIFTLLASLIFLPLVIWLFKPNMHYYRGLSGICSALYICASIYLVKDAFSSKNLTLLLFSGGSIMLFIFKILYESICGQAIFVHNNNLFHPVPLVHLTGGLVGLFSALFTLHHFHQASSKKEDDSQISLALQQIGTETGFYETGEKTTGIPQFSQPVYPE